MTLAKQPVPFPALTEEQRRLYSAFTRENGFTLEHALELYEVQGRELLTAFRENSLDLVADIRDLDARVAVLERDRAELQAGLLELKRNWKSE